MVVVTPKYPKRPKNFAYKFCRLMAKTTLANELGTDACWLLTVIVMTEDARHYRGPVNFWNHQLMGVAGIGSAPALIRVRTRCVEAGWLTYTPGGNRRPATYHVVIPAGLKGVKDDTALGEDPADSPLESEPDSVNASGTEPLTEPLTELEGRGGSINENDTRTVNHGGITAESKRRSSNPDPDPDPNTLAAAAPPREGESPSRGKKRNLPAEPRPRNDLFDAVAEVTGSDPSLNGSIVGKVAAALAKAATPYTPAEVREFARRFHELCPWAAKDGRARPTVPELQKNISRLRAGKPKAAPRPVRTAADVEAEMARRDPLPTPGPASSAPPGDR